MLRMVLLCLALTYVGLLPAQLIITPQFGSGDDPVELVQESCFGPGIEIIDFDFEGVPDAIGLFSGGEEIVGIEEGFIMTTGAADTRFNGFGADGPVTERAMVDNMSTAQYPGLEPYLSDQDTRDVAIIRFRFVPTGSNLLFRYVFASDEYPEYVCSNFNDVFGFFLTGPNATDGSIVTTNIATVPGTDLPVSINSINAGEIGTQPIVDPVYCEGPLGSLDHAELFNYTQSGMVYNGYTDIFEATAQVIPCQEYVMELVLADVGDAFWDSGIFFEANSFCSFETGVMADVDAENRVLIEGCDQEPLSFLFTGYEADDFPFNYRIEGEATAGVDYSAPNSGLINNAQFELPLEVFADQETEGTELLHVIFEVSECLEDTVTFYLVDALQIEGPDQISCTEVPIELLVAPSDEEIDWFSALSLEWATGDTTASISVSPEETTTYTLGYSNALNSCSTDYTVAVGDPIVEIGGPLCHNEDGVVVNGTLYNLNNPMGIEVFPGNNGCDSVVIINFEPVAFANLTQTLCSGESLEINGVVYDETNDEGLEIFSGVTAEGCDSVVYVDLSFLPLDTVFFEGQLCAEESVEINGTIYNMDNPSGEEYVEGGSDNGCDAIYRVFYDFYPVSDSDLLVTINEGESYSYNGVDYQTAGIYEIHLTNQNGCDSLVKLSIDIATTSAFVTDSILVGDNIEYCLDVSFLGASIAIENSCENFNGAATFTIDESQACIDYTGLAPGVTDACIVACDEFTCDTTYFEISVFANFLDAVDDLDSTVYGQAVDIDVLANDWTSATTITDQYLVELPDFGSAEIDGDGSIGYFPDAGGCDQEVTFSYALCNAIGCDTATVTVLLRDTIDLCNGVWPGDVRPDGIVNVVDFWAIGLGFYETGPVRANATIEWEPQPASDWNQYITFIEQIDLKHADCNGDGIVNPDDYEAIELNMGQTHNFTGDEEAFAKIVLPFSYQLNVKANGQIEIEILLGTSDQPIERISGLAFTANVNHKLTDLNFDLENGWLKTANQELYVLENQDLDSGKALWAISREANAPASGWGRIGSLEIDGEDLEEQTLILDDIRVLLNGTEIYQVDPVVIELGAMTTSMSPDLSAEQWTLYPNPVDNQLYIQKNDFRGSYRLSVLNMQGQTLKNRMVNRVDYQLDVSDLQPGVYFVQLQSGKEWESHKVVVK